MKKPPPPKKILNVLKTTFGLDELRPLQREVIESVLAGEPTLAIMPTGAGKSLCYQIPSVLLEGTTIVVSPLIALMKDQKEKMDELHIPSVELNSSLSEKSQSQGLRKIVGGKAEIMYVTPERLSDQVFLKSLQDVKVSLLVLDEAHCMTQWGHDFRPSYLAIRDAWVGLGRPGFLALTATATHEVIDDLKLQMKLPALKVFHSGVLRANLHYEAIHAESEDEKLTNLARLVSELGPSGSGIIYSATVKGVEAIADRLDAAGIPNVRYHGKLAAKVRSENQNLFMSGELSLIVATNAFGMGIDKADIRYVIHFHFPGSLEAYYQESGRAGRDGLDARCILLYLKQDKRTQSFFLAGKYPSVDDIKAVYRQLQQQEDLEKLVAVGKSKKRVVLSALKQRGIIANSRKDGLRLKNAKLTESEIQVIAEDYIRKSEHDRSKLKQMIVYAQTALCRWKILLNYFEQAATWQLCGHCDNCSQETARLIS